MISRERWRRVEPILDAAVELPTEEASAYLDQACTGDPEVREEVERLLTMVRQERDGVGFLDSPPTALAARILSGTDTGADAPGDLAAGAEIGPYRVLRRLGGGGMGVVYLARDPRLDRLVAVKLLPPWLDTDELAAHRLAEEAKAASALDHPNIETVYDIGHTGEGRPYIAMAYYEGETLADRIRRGPLPVKEAVALAGQLARGLEAAHSRGIVHRDIKPANVIVTLDGVAKIVDFGVAKASGPDVTAPGATPGTVAYMSPEQTRGLGIDARTDLWSLGVVLYEMLTGRRPFHRDDRDAVIFAIRHDEPEPLARSRPDVPDYLARLVQRCLAKDTGERYQTAGELRADLSLVLEGAHGTGRRRKGALAAALAAIAAVALVVGLLLSPRSRAGMVLGSGDGSAWAPAARLAVLPLADVSPEAEDAYFADGLTAELISGLSQLADLRVTALTSVMPFGDTDKSMAEIGRELGVATLLAGSVAKTGEGIRISVRLVDARSQAQLWVDDYEAAIGDLPMVRRDIVERVAAALRMRTSERRELASRGAENADAYMEYLKGRYFLGKLESDATQDARSHFERSLDLDPTFAPAWSGLSGAYNQLAVRGLLAAREAGPRARAAAERALALDPELPEAHAHLASAMSWYYGDRESAERHFRHALELEPSSARAHRHYAVHLRNQGRFEQALTVVRRAREMDPLSPGSYAQEGVILYMARRYDDAITKLQQLLRIDPQYTPAHFYIALVRAQMGQYDEALAALREADPQGNQPNALTIRGYVLARLGLPDEAHRMLARLDELSAPGAPDSYEKAVIYVGLGEHGRALDLLEEAAEQRLFQVRLLKVEPVFDPLREEPRFQALLEKLNLMG